MKINKIHLAYILVASIIVCSCSKMNDLSDKYLDEGETIYAAKVNEVVSHAGRNRIALEIIIRSQRIKTVRIFWNNNSDSTDVKIDNKTGTFMKTIDKLDERTYVFQLVSIDEAGNKSLSLEVSGKAYGDNFQSTLLNRSVLSINSSQTGNKVIVWGNLTMDDARYTELLYTNRDDEEVVLKTLVNEPETLIPDLKPGTKFSYRTAYMPGKMGVDTFYTAFKDGELKHFPDFMLLKSEWTLLNFSDQHGGNDNAAKNAIDGNYENRWHSNASPMTPYPHWLTIDLGGEVIIKRFCIWGSMYSLNPGQIVDDRLPSKFKLLGRTTPPSNPDNDNEWTLLGEFDCEFGKPGEQLYNLENLTRTRYFKFVGIQGGADANIISLGEIDIYTE